ncbi:MAG TPA: chloride channel protein [Steroidobacteraceae bacterium]|nr:chloride channel protein [Steroidobacteraceae bacterium]
MTPTPHDPFEAEHETLQPAGAVMRNASRTFLSLRHWRARFLLWLAAAAVGGAAVGFAKIADLAQGELRRLVAVWPYAPWLLAPLGFCGAAWATRRYFRGAEGSGIPQTIFTLLPDAGEAGARLLRPRVVIGRMVLAAVGLFCGGSIGREGPTVHVGAVITHIFGRWIPHGGTSAQRRALILAGGAAGVAAAFNTPLAGIVFAIEELSRSFEERASGATLTAVVLAGVMSIVLVGEYTYFGQPQVSPAAYQVELSTFIVAIAGGLAGGLFSRLTLLSVAGLPSVLGKLQRERPALFAALCGLSVALVGWAAGGLTYGTGYNEARSVLEGHAHLPWFYMPARAFATLAAYLSGIPAGLLAPSLSAGAGLGQLVADLLGQSTAVPLAILGMCGYLAGVTQAPLTSFVIVMEMTTRHEMVLPLMVTAAVATTVSKILSPPLYRALALRYALPPAPSPAAAQAPSAAGAT